MSSIAEPNFDFCKYRYSFSRATHEITHREEASTPEENAALLLQDKAELQKDIAPSRLYQITRWTSSLIKVLEDPDRGKLSFITRLVRSRLPRDELIALQTQIAARLAALEKQKRLEMQRRLDDPPITQLELLERLSEASPALLQSPPFIKAKEIFLKAFPLQLSQGDIETAASKIEEILPLDPECDWLQECAKQTPSSRQIRTVTGALDHLTRNACFTNKEAKNSFLLFLKIYDHLTQCGIAETAAFAWACSMLQVSQSRVPSDSDWQSLLASLDALLPAKEECIGLSLSIFKEIHTLTSDNNRYPSLLQTGINAFIEKNAWLRKRYMQLHTIPSDTSTLTDLEMVELSYFIERSFRFPCDFTHGKIKKGPELPVSLQRDGESGDVYLLLSRKKVTFFDGAPGALKKPRAILRLSSNPLEKAAIFCQTINRTILKVDPKPKKATPEKAPLPKRYADEATRQKLVNEVALQLARRGRRGIWPIYTYCEYTKIVDAKEIPMVSIISPMGSLIDTPEIACLDMQTKHALMLDLAYGLLDMHNERLFHGDIKPGNVLIGKDEKGKYYAGLIDFGHTEQIAPTGISELTSQGTYGTIHYTAPELLGKRHAALDCFKLDVWALGNVFYLLLTSKDPSWKMDAFDRGQEIKKPVHEVQQALITCISQDIEKPLRKLEEKEKYTVEERTLRLVYYMLRQVAAQRWNIAQVVRELQDIMSQKDDEV